MRVLVSAVPVSLLGLVLALACSDGTSPGDTVRPAFSTAGRSGFGFQGSAGGPTGTVRLSGGGSFDPARASNTVPAVTSASTSGGFRCTETVAQGPLTGCLAGQGVRWDTEQLLASTTFKCSASDAPIPFTTDDHAAALLAYRLTGDDGQFVNSDDVTVTVNPAPALVGAAACLITDAFGITPALARMYRASGQAVPVGKRILELNPNHRLITGLQQAHHDRGEDSVLVETAELLYGTALLAEGGALEDPAKFAGLLADRLARTV